MHNDKVVLRLLHLALAEARRVHLDEDDAHDCAMEMVLHALQQANAALAFPSSGCFVLRDDLSPEPAARWLRRCARNFALNYRRNVDTRQSHETVGAGSFFCHEPETGKYAVGDTVEGMALAPSAETDAFSRLFQRDVYAAVHELPPAARVLFARFHLRGDSLDEIALSSGKSQEAVKKTIHRLPATFAPRLSSKATATRNKQQKSGRKGGLKKNSIIFAYL